MSLSDLSIGSNADMPGSTAPMTAKRPIEIMLNIIVRLSLSIMVFVECQVKEVIKICRILDLHKILTVLAGDGRSDSFVFFVGRLRILLNFVNRRLQSILVTAGASTSWRLETFGQTVVLKHII